MYQFRYIVDSINHCLVTTYFIAKKFSKMFIKFCKKNYQNIAKISKVILVSSTAVSIVAYNNNLKFKIFSNFYSICDQADSNNNRDSDNTSLSTKISNSSLRRYVENRIYYKW